MIDCSNCTSEDTEAPVLPHAFTTPEGTHMDVHGIGAVKDARKHIRGPMGVWMTQMATKGPTGCGVLR